MSEHCTMGAAQPERIVEQDDLPVLGREAILAAQDLDLGFVEVPEWGGGVYIRTMTGAERDSLEARITAGEKLTRARMAVMVCCDAAGELLFTRADEADLDGKSASAMDRILEAALSHNRLRGQDIEEAVKNSEAAQSGGNGSA